MKPHSVLAAATLSAAFVMPAAAVSVYSATMLGSNENPANASPATGSAVITVDEAVATMRVQLNFAGLTGGNAVAAHIHCCIAPPGNVGVAVGFPVFPAATSGTYDHTFNMTDSSVYTAAFMSGFGGGTAAGSFTALIAGLNAGTAYTNIHNATFGGGEIRGFVTAVPESATRALMLGGLGLVGAAVGRKRAV